MSIAAATVTEPVTLTESPGALLALLEAVQANIVFADTDLNIAYLNEYAQRTLEALEPELIRCFGLHADELLEGSIHRFHRDPKQVERILSDPRNFPHRASFRFGRVSFEATVNGVWTRNRQLLGYVVSLVDVSGERDKAAELERVNQKTQQLTANISKLSEHSKALESSSEQLSQVSARVTYSANETTMQANMASAAAEEISVNIQTVSESTHQMTDSIREISASATDAAQVAQKGVHIADNANTTVQRLGQSSKQIGKVVKVITSIAQQTNLLALNATIEAARAGEAGKGFAVVATEVKELAKETAKATEDISQKIEAIQSDTQDAVEAIGQISSIIGHISELQITIASAVEEQTVTTNDIGRNLAEAAKGSTEIAQNIGTVAHQASSTQDGIRDASEASEEVFEISRGLMSLVEALR